MGYQFGIVRLRKGSEDLLVFPADIVELTQNPLAGPFDEATRDTLAAAVSLFPGTRRTGDFRNCFEVVGSEGGRLEVWMASDGHLFIDSQGGLELLFSLFEHLALACEDLAIEDTRLGLLHSAQSFEAWLDGDEQHAAAA